MSKSGKHRAITTPSATGYARYVGRVGALAVALGIGAAVIGTPATAWALPDTTNTPNDPAPTPKDDPTDTHVGDDTPAPNPALGLPDPQPPTNATAGPNDGVASSKVDPRDGLIAIAEHVDPPGGGASPSGLGVTTPIPSAPEPPAGPPPPTLPTPPSQPVVVDITPPTGLTLAKPIPLADDNRSATPAITSKKLDPLMAPGAANVVVPAAPMSLGTPAPKGVGVPEVVQPQVFSKNTTTTMMTATAAPAAAPATPGAVVAAAVNQFLSAFGLAPSAGGGPLAPLQSPAMWALAGWAVRRPLGQTGPTVAAPGASTDTAQPLTTTDDQVTTFASFASFAALAAPNTAPTGTPSTGNPDLITGAVTGAVNGTDAEGDVLTYTLTTAPTRGTLTANPATGTFTYQPSQAARLAAHTTPGPDTDTFVVTISDGQASTAVTVTVPVSAADFSVNPATTTTGAGPAGVVVANNRVYVANLNANTVSVINPTTNTVVATVAVVASPAAVAANATGTRVYVAGYNGVSVINTTTNTVTNVFTGGGQSYGIAVSPDGSKVYVTNSGTNSLGVINTATNTLTQVTFGLGQMPAGVTFSPNGTRAYVTNLNSNTVSVINTATNQVLGAPIPVGTNPYGITASADGTRVYTANWNGTLTAINTATNTALGTIPVGATPFGITTSPDGTLAYVANSDDTISVINTTTGATLRTIAIDPTPEVAPHLLALSADGRTLYVTDLADNRLRSLTLISSNQPPVLTTTGGQTSFTEQQPIAVDANLTLTDADNTNLTGATVTLTAPTSTESLTFTPPSGSGITGNYNAGSGVLTLTGTSSVANYQTVLRSVTYQNTSDTPLLARTVTFTVTDGSDTATATKTITVTAVNDKPVVTTSGGATSYTEQGTPVIVDNGLTVTDPDSATLTGATVTLTAPSSTETLGFTPSNGITGSYSNGVLTLTGTTSAADYQTVLRTVTYQNTSDAPTSPHTISFVTTDATTPSTTATKTITVTAVNDAPVVTTTGGSTGYTEQAPAVVIDSGITVTDPDSATLTGATITILFDAQPTETLAFTAGNGITGNYSNGVLTLTGTTTVANYQTALQSVTYRNTSDTPATPRTISFTVTDGSSTSILANQVINVTAVNDRPEVTTSTGTTAYTEQALPAVIDGLLTVTDRDSTTLTGATIFMGSSNPTATLAFTPSSGITGSYDATSGVLTLTGTTSAANYQTVLRSITYSNTSDNPPATVAITFLVNDGDGNSLNAIKTITITRVNDAPLVTTAVGNTTYTEQANPKVVDGALTVTDVDSATLTGASITITSPSSTETLGFTAGNGITGSYSNGVLTLTGTTSAANYQTVLRSVTYRDTSDAPATTRTITFTVTDGSLTSAAAVKTITITAVNDAPVVTPTVGNAAYTEQAPATVIDAGITVTDPDSATLTGATISITSPSSTETLGFTAGNGITGNYSNGVLTLTGTTSAANYQTALQSVTYQNTSDTPPVSRTITVTITDGTTPSVAATKTVSITNVNDAPVFSNVSIGQPTGDKGIVTGTITFTDPDGNTLSYSGGTTTQGGTVTVTSAGVITYTPKPESRLAAFITPGADVDSFTITASDGQGGQTTYTVNLVPINPAPAVVTTVINAGSAQSIGFADRVPVVGPDGNLYLTAQGFNNDRTTVQVINPTTRAITTIRFPADGDPTYQLAFGQNGKAYTNVYTSTQTQGAGGEQITTYTTTVYELDPVAGTATAISGPLDGDPRGVMVDAAGFVYQSTASGLTVINAGTRQVATVPLRGLAFGPAVSGGDGRAYQVTFSRTINGVTEPPTLVVVDPNNPSLATTIVLSGVAGAPVVGPNGTVFVVDRSATSRVLVFRPGIQSPITTALGGEAQGSPVIGSNGITYQAVRTGSNSTGKIVAINPTTGAVTTVATPTGQLLGQLTAGPNGKLYIGTGFALAIIDPSNGSVSSVALSGVTDTAPKVTASGDVYQILRIPQSGAADVYALALIDADTNAVTNITLPTGTRPSGLAVRADGTGFLTLTPSGSAGSSDVGRSYTLVINPANGTATTFPLNGIVEGAPVIGLDGTAYQLRYTTTSGEFGNYLTAFQAIDPALTPPPIMP